MLNWKRILSQSWFHVGFMLVTVIEKVVGDDVGENDVDGMLRNINRRVIIKFGGDIGSGIGGNCVNWFKTSSGGGLYDTLKTIGILKNLVLNNKKKIDPNFQTDKLMTYLKTFFFLSFFQF